MDTATTARQMTARRLLLIVAVVLGVIGMHSLVSCMGSVDPADMVHSSASHAADPIPAGSMPADHHSGDRSCVDHCVGIIMTIAQIAAIVLTLIAAILVVATACTTSSSTGARQRSSGTSPPWTTLSLTQLSVLRV